MPADRLRPELNEPRILPSDQKEKLMSETSSSSNAIEVHSVTTADLDDILRLARAAQLNPETDTEKGFLVAALDRDTYANALAYSELRDNAEHVVFLVAKNNENAVGFLFGYNSVYASRRSGGESEAEIAARCKDTYYVLKQIAADSNGRHKGVGRVLVQEFLSRLRCAYVFSAIVTDPANPASSAFHHKMGFVPVFSSVSRSSSGQTYPNQVWRRTCLA
jgi:predicted GNAT superfamily acetyltransferase